VERVTRLIPMGRFADVDEIASACLFLAADTGAFITGQVLHVNGGESTFSS
jgi:3-oxoacyl-[acyl-carrier protein] reductase